MQALAGQSLQKLEDTFIKMKKWGYQERNSSACSEHISLSDAYVYFHFFSQPLFLAIVFVYFVLGNYTCFLIHQLQALG